jgi:hypothetical protein
MRQGQWHGTAAPAGPALPLDPADTRLLASRRCAFSSTIPTIRLKLRHHTKMRVKLVNTIVLDFHSILYNQSLAVFANRTFYG